MNLAEPMEPATPVFLFTGGNQHGPYPLSKVWDMCREFRYSPQDYFWHAGLPEWRRLHQLPRPPESPRTEPDHNGRVLVADDDIIARGLITDILEREKLAVDAVGGLADALALVEQHGITRYDAVITDFEMPGGSGVELVSQLKQRDRALQFIMLTAIDDKEVVKLGLRAGINDFLEKPIRRAALLNSLHLAIEKTTRQREERAAFLEIVRQRLVGRGVLADKVMSELAHRESALGTLLGKLDTVTRYSEELEKSDTEIFPGTRVYEDTRPFQGPLGELSILDLVQMLIHASKTGELVINSRHGTECGRIYMVGGAIHHATAVEAADGEAALKRIVREQQGSFRFHYGVTHSIRTIQGNSITVLLGITSEIDTARGLAAA